MPPFFSESKKENILRKLEFNNQTTTEQANNTPLQEEFIAQNDGTLIGFRILHQQVNKNAQHMYTYLHCPNYLKQSSQHSFEIGLCQETVLGKFGKLGKH
jgi:hypothetical protein